MKRQLLVFAVSSVFLSLMLPLSALAIQLSVSPTNMVWNANGWVNLVISNVAPHAAVDLRLYVDVDNDGVVDTNKDVFFTSFQLTDGATNVLGSVVMPDDEDGMTNGSSQPVFRISELRGFCTASARTLGGPWRSPVGHRPRRDLRLPSRRVRCG